MVITLWIASSTVVLILAGVVYQHLGSLHDRRRYAGSGRWVSVGNGCELYLFEMGEGEPTVVFESGIGATHLNWRRIQECVGQFATTISYDRGGLGWSDRCESARTPANIAAELHQMLHSAGLKPPFYLVGHSFGGLVMRRFALLYPEEVAAVLLVDPMRCEEWPPLDPTKQAQLELGKKMIRYAIPVTRCGLARLAVTLLFCRARRITGHLASAAVPNGKHALDRVTTEVRKMPQTVWPIVAAHWSRPTFYAGVRSHLHSIPDTVREMHVAEPIRAIPVTVLTPTNAEPLTENQLDHIGDNVEQVIASQSAHWIHLDEPDLVIDCIRAMVTVPTAERVRVGEWQAQGNSAILEPSFPVKEF
jgi:pimeloyl-ACP methyl ester carboxylesterase